MRNLFLLLVLLICILTYVWAEQPATWNSWMVALGANGLVTPATADGSIAPAAARVPQVGGLLKNGNFVVGGGAWEGDCTMDASGKALVVKLDPSSWTRVYQTFPDQGGPVSIEITYKFSPGLTVSRDPADYTDISNRLQIPGFERFRSLAMSPGEFYGTVGDPNGDDISMEVFSPTMGSTDVQDYQHDYPAIPGSATTTFALAFPPGNGTITLLTAYLTSH